MEMSHVAVLNKWKCLFSKTKVRKEKQVLSGVGTSGGGRYKERV
jgi:hypothetical protein